MWPPLLYSDLPYHISTPTRPYTGDFGDSHGYFGDFTYPNSSLPNPPTPNPTHPYPDLPYHIISTPTRPYNGDFGDSHGDFGFSGDPYIYVSDIACTICSETNENRSVWMLCRIDENCSFIGFYQKSHFPIF